MIIRNTINDLINCFTFYKRYKNFFIRVIKKNNRFARVSFSECAEDLILETLILMSQAKIQCFVDLGASHPKIGNDTYIFYNQDFLILNIEPVPANFLLLKKFRKRDLNLEAAIVIDDEIEVNFEINPEARLSKISTRSTDIKVKTITVEKVLEYIDIIDNYVLKIDIEGNDYSILKKFLSFKKIPLIVQIETFDGIKGKYNSKFDRLMNQHNYLCVAKTPLNSFYILKSAWTFAD